MAMTKQKMEDMLYITWDLLIDAVRCLSPGCNERTEIETQLENVVYPQLASLLDGRNKSKKAKYEKTRKKAMKAKKITKKAMKSMKSINKSKKTNTLKRPALKIA